MSARPADFVARSELLAALRAAGATPLLQRLAEQTAASSGTTIPKITTGVLTGTLTGTRGQPLAGACVTAVSATRTVMALTGPNGSYSLGGLQPGKYTLSYRDCARPGRYFEQWSGGTTWPSLARSVIVRVGRVRTVPAIRLRPTNPVTLLPTRSRLTANGAGRANRPASKGTASISGVVTGDGKPLRGICVSQAQLHNGFSIGFDTTTSRSGRYVFSKLARGRYQITFEPTEDCLDNPGNWLQQFYKGVTSVFPPENQTTIRLRSGQHLRHVDARLRRGSQISGTVTSKNGTKLRGICVDIFGQVRGGFIGTEVVTAKGGRYAWHGVFPGRYIVNFTAGCGNKGNFAPQWWPHSATFKHAKPVRVTGTKIHSRIDAVLQPGAAVTGRVTARSTGKGVGQVCVDASNSDGTIDVAATTRADGRYRINGLATGRYFVQFDPTCGNLNLLGTQRFVTVTAGKTTTGFDISLRPGAGISGKVQNTHGHLLDGICVNVEDSFGDAVESETDNGNYSILGLTPSQTSTVEFTGGCDNNGNFAPQFYDNRAIPTLADPISLKAGVIKSGVDATMQPGGTISGMVTSAAGHPLTNVCVAIAAGGESLFGDFFEDLAFTSNGRYRDQNLAPGPYLVDFGCGGGPFADQWFRAQPTVDQADVISVGSGAATSGINAVLHRAGAISGVVTNKSGRRLSNICVSVVNRRTGVQLFNAFQGDIVVTQNGRYTFPGVAPGRYDVLFSDGCAESAKYGSQWYSGKRTEASATPVRVTAGRTATGIDATMALGGSISGRVISNHGRPVNNMCVSAFDNATSSFRFGETRKTGAYTIPGLSTGSYTLSFDPCNDQNLVSVLRSGTVRVAAPHGVRGINATMQPGGVISGSVSLNVAPSRPLAMGCVEAISPHHGVEAFGFTGPNGGYSVNGLATGSYRVLFGCFGNTGFAPQWYRNKPTESSADPVQVTAGSKTDKINARLRLGGLGAISGHVTRSGGAAVTGECVTAFPLHPSNPTFGFVQPQIGVTSRSGTYSLTDLVPGQYKVRFDVGCGATGLATQWWQGASSRARATVITVAANATVTGISATLRH